MPELPEVEAARRLLERLCVGKVVRTCVTTPDEKVFVGGCSEALAKHMAGTRVIAACRKGKQLWLELERAPHPSFHLGMTGSFAALKVDGTVEAAEYVNSKVDATAA
ncbi:DNA glycosylase/AP lyase [Baffinella frigidus]|nr:DNA glycosylase/AP lyase [Cryptophyta sp. CCMP2293]